MPPHRIRCMAWPSAGGSVIRTSDPVRPSWALPAPIHADAPARLREPWCMWCVRAMGQWTGWRVHSSVQHPSNISVKPQKHANSRFSLFSSEMHFIQNFKYPPLKFENYFQPFIGYWLLVEIVGLTTGGAMVITPTRHPVRFYCGREHPRHTGTTCSLGVVGGGGTVGRSRGSAHGA